MINNIIINKADSQIKQNPINYDKQKANSTEGMKITSCNSVPLGAYTDKLLPKLPAFIAFQHFGKDNSMQVANQLKQLDGSLDEKILKAKDIILKDLGIPPEVVICENKNCGAGVYAGTSLTQGKIYYNKELCQSPNSQFSDNAVLCILRHELDHLVVCAKLYKTLGAERYEQLMQTEAIKKVLPPEMQKVNHEIFQKLIPYVDTKGFEFRNNKLKNFS